MKCLPFSASKRVVCSRADASQDRKHNADAFAFTIVELLVVLGLAAMLYVLAWPTLASHQARSKQLHCLNNLSQVGRAFAVWGADHRDRVPLMTPWWEGGSVPMRQSAPPGSGVPPVWLTGGLYNNVWFQYWWMSNELVSPKILACPADPDKKAASDWLTSASGGFLNPRYQNSAVSYTVNHPSLQDGRLLLSTDRSASYVPTQSTCSFGYTPNRTFARTTTQTWNDRLHPRSGNLLFNDGSVEQADEHELTAAAALGLGDVGEPHYLSP